MAYLTGGARSGGTQLPVDTVEHAVAARVRVAGAELLGDRECLVDGDRARHVGLVEQLVDRHPQYIAIHHGHPLEVPVLRGLGDDDVDLGLLRLGAAHERGGEGARVVVDGMAFPEVVLERRGIAGARLVELIEELQRDFSSLAPFSHAPSPTSRMRPSPPPRPRPPRRGWRPRGQPCQSGRDERRWPSLSRLVLRYLRFSGFAGISIGTRSTTVRPYPSIPARLAGLLVSRRRFLRPRSTRICAPMP